MLDNDDTELPMFTSNRNLVNTKDLFLAKGYRLRKKECFFSIFFLVFIAIFSIAQFAVMLDLCIQVNNFVYSDSLRTIISKVESIVDIICSDINCK